MPTVRRAILERFAGERQVFVLTNRELKDYILKNFTNIQAARFQTIGHGAANPMADNSTEAGRQLNRRTDIKVVLATE